MSTADDLRQVELFSELGDRDLGRLVRSVVSRTYQKGDVILKEGAAGVALYIVRKGRVELIRGLGTTDEVPMFVHGPGSFFGEMSLLLNEPRSLTARAAEDETECLVLTKWDFEAELHTPGSRVALSLLPVLARRARSFISDTHTH